MAKKSLGPGRFCGDPTQKLISPAGRSTKDVTQFLHFRKARHGSIV
jgi:hypothetical protein